MAHGAAAVATIGFCALLLAQLPAGAAVPVKWRLQARDGRPHVETFAAPFTESAGAFGVRQIAIGLASALAFRHLTRRSRASRASYPDEVRMLLESGWREERALPALAAVSFLVVAAGLLYPLVADSFVAVAGHQREAVLTVLLAVPLLTGALAAAASASAVARAGLRKATVVGASAHLVAGVAVIATPVAMLAMLGLISGDARAVLMAPMVVLIYYGPFLVAALAAQTIVGVVATLLFWLGGSRLATRQTIRATRS